MRINFNAIARLAKKALENQDRSGSATDAVIADKIKEKLNISAFKKGGPVKKTAAKKKIVKKS